MRDDAWGGNNFADLADGGDTIAGMRVVSGVTVPPVCTMLGTQRVGSRIAIAVDPRNRQRVYLGWCDGPDHRVAVYPARATDGHRRGDLDRRLVHDRERDEPRSGRQRAGRGGADVPATRDRGRHPARSTELERSTDRFATVATTSVWRT